MKQDIKDRVVDRLHSIEHEHNVRIIYAAEAGSRAWGFSSPDSDYDVRFVYVRRIRDYLTIQEKRRDVIEITPHTTFKAETPPEGGPAEIQDVMDLDINGWDITKTLRLLNKSNPNLLEWFYSPVQYINLPEIDKVRQQLVRCFIPRNAIYHYLHMAKGNFREYLQGDKVRLKKYLYVTRPILACRYIQQNNRMPPVQFDTLFEQTKPGDADLVLHIDNLIAEKKRGNELSEGDRIDPLNDWLNAEIKRFESAAKGFEPKNEVTIDELNNLFHGVVGL